MGAAVSNALLKAIGNQVSQGTVCEMVKDATVQIKAQPKVRLMMVGGFTKSNKLMSVIAKFVETTVEQGTKKTKYIDTKEPHIEVNPTSPPSSYRPS